MTSNWRFRRTKASDLTKHLHSEHTQMMDDAAQKSWQQVRLLHYIIAKSQSGMSVITRTLSINNLTDIFVCVYRDSWLTYTLSTLQSPGVMRPNKTAAIIINLHHKRMI